VTFAPLMAFTHALESFRLREELMVDHVATQILFSIYTKQAKMVGLKIRKYELDPVNFELATNAYLQSVPYTALRQREKEMNRDKEEEIQLLPESKPKIVQDDEEEEDDDLQSGQTTPKSPGLNKRSFTSSTDENDLMGFGNKNNNDQQINKDASTKKKRKYWHTSSEESETQIQKLIEFDQPSQQSKEEQDKRLEQEQGMPINPSNITELVDENGDLKQFDPITHMNFAIAEFEPNMAQFDFTTQQGCQLILIETGIDELRSAVQMQQLQRLLLQIVVQYNQVPIDQFFIMLREKEIQLKLRLPDGNLAPLPKDLHLMANQPPTDNTNSSITNQLFARALSTLSKQQYQLRQQSLQKAQQMYEDRKKKLRRWKRAAIRDAASFFLPLNSRKAAVRELHMSAFVEACTVIQKKERRGEIPRRQRKLKYELINWFCTDMITDMQIFILRIQMVKSIVDFRREIIDSQTVSPFVLGTVDIDKIGPMGILNQMDEVNDVLDVIADQKQLQTQSIAKSNQQNKSVFQTLCQNGSIQNVLPIPPLTPRIPPPIKYYCIDEISSPLIYDQIADKLAYLLKT
ncbi:MAG: hypothetical protein EZS28_040959, partial [Streblomastix strix]